MPRYKATGISPVSLHSGRQLAPGEQVSKEDLAPEDQGHIDRKRLVELPSTRKRTPKES